MAFYVGMDAGGSRTRVAVSEDGRELARVTGESVKTLRVAEADADARLGRLLEDLGSQAGVDLRYVESSCVGLSGVSVTAVRAFVANVFAKRVGGTLEIVGDQIVALEAAFKGGDGILAIAGTGSNVGGRFRGQLFNAGGWGPMLGDEGSGHWIGVEAIKAALHVKDRGVESLLLKEVQKKWVVDSTVDLVAAAHRPEADFAGLAQVVAKCAESGDVLAANVLESAGIELAEQVLVVHSKMLAAGFAADQCGVAYTGSVLGKITAVRQSFQAVLKERLEGVWFVDGEADAVEGALWRAQAKAMSR